MNLLQAFKMAFKSISCKKMRSFLPLPKKVLRGENTFEKFLTVLFVHNGHV